MALTNDRPKSFAANTSYSLGAVPRTEKPLAGKTLGPMSLTSHDSPKTSATKLQTLLEKRQSAIQTLQMMKDDKKLITSDSDSQDTLSMEDLATLLNDSYHLTKHLEEQVKFYQDAVNVLRQRSERIVAENEMLYEKLKRNFVTDVLQRERSGPLLKDEARPLTADHRGKSEFKKTEKREKKYPKEAVAKEEAPLSSDEVLTVGFNFQDRQYCYQLEQEMDQIKKLNQDKTHCLESILKSTRDDLEQYRCENLKLQSQLRSFETKDEQRHDTICSKCRRKEGIFFVQPTNAHQKTMEKLTRERDELMEMLAKQKSSLTQSQQREFEAYIEVKKSVETVEKAQLEKAEAIIKIQQLRNSIEEERKKHQNQLTSAKEKAKGECADIKDIYEKKIEDLRSHTQDITQKCDTTENQLDKLSREKVNLMDELEKAKAELAASQADLAKVTQDAQEEALHITRQRVKAEQEVDNLQNLQTRRLREHEQEKAALLTENEELKRRLAEAQDGWVKSREECIRTMEKMKKLENDLYLVTTSKANLEKTRQENAEFLRKQEDQRERQFLETLQEKEEEHVALRRELEEMLEKQMQISKMVKDESKKLSQKLEEKTQKHRSDKKQWRHQHSQLTTELQTLRKQHEIITSENQKGVKVNKQLSTTVETLKEENKKALKTIYEQLKKQNGLMQDRQALCREVEYLRSNVVFSSHVLPEQELSPYATESQDDTLSNTKPIIVETSETDKSL